MKGRLAAPLAEAGVAFSAAVHTATTTARGLVNLVNLLAVSIVGMKARDAIVTILLDGSDGLTT